MGVPVATYSQRRAGYYSVREYGAKGDGSTDDTTAIEAAWTAAQALTPNVGVLYFPAGTFVYNGTGLIPSLPAGTARVSITGASRATSKIKLGATSPLLLVSTVMTRCEIRGLWFNGGTDIIRSTYTGADTTNDIRIIEDNFFESFTGCAIQNNASDSAWWQIQRNKFRGGNIDTGIGIAIGGLADESVIASNSFDGQLRVCIKVVRGPNVHIQNNGLVFGGGTPSAARAKIWIVPQPSSPTNANGMSIIGNKFGNENAVSGDFQILIADGTTAEDGSTNLRGNILPSTSVSTGFWVGATISHNMFGNAGTVGSPTSSAWLYSYTAALRGLIIALNSSQGTPHNYVAQIDAGVTVGADRFNNDNLILDNTFDTAGVSTVAPTATNQPGMFRLRDTAGNLATKAQSVLSYHGGGALAGFTDLLTTAPSAYSVAGSALLVGSVADSQGGADAAEYSVTTSASSLVNKAITTPTVGNPVWVEFELKQGTSSPLSQIQVGLRYGGSTQHWARVCEVPAAWSRYRFLWHPRETSAAIQFQFVSLGTAGSFQFGRVSIYHAQSPVNLGAIKMRSPNGTLHTITVDNTGTLVVA